MGASVPNNRPNEPKITSITTSNPVPRHGLSQHGQSQFQISDHSIGLAGQQNASLANYSNAQAFITTNGIVIK